jgi:hypothetical protein
MRADNSSYITAHARRRAAATRKRAITALRRLDNTGAVITMNAVAREAGVSRSWLYQQSDLRAEIERLRARRDSPSPRRSVPDKQRATEASLLQRLECATDRLKQLEKENHELRQALALALGERRIQAVVGGRRDTPNKKSAPMIGPC